jgi:hypothetical protein
LTAYFQSGNIQGREQKVKNIEATKACTTQKYLIVEYFLEFQFRKPIG